MAVTTAIDGKEIDSGNPDALILIVDDVLAVGDRVFETTDRKVEREHSCATCHAMMYRYGTGQALTILIKLDGLKFTIDFKVSDCTDREMALFTGHWRAPAGRA